MEEFLKKEESKLKAVEEKMGSITHIAPILKELKTLIPNGLWLDRMTVTDTGEGNFSMLLLGYIYLDDPNKEAESLDRFISYITENKAIKKIFSDVELLVRERGTIENFNVTRFKLKLY
jgi:hypothetical protein